MGSSQRRRGVRRAGHLLLDVGSGVPVAKAGEVRYLRINVSFLLPRRQLVVQIGHEMRHAVEISENPAIVSAGTMKGR